MDPVVDIANEENAGIAQDNPQAEAADEPNVQGPINAPPQGQNVAQAQDDVNWNLMEWDRAEELTWERLLGLDGSLVFLEHVFWVASLNTLFILVFGKSYSIRQTILMYNCENFPSLLPLPHWTFHNRWF